MRLLLLHKSLYEFLADPGFFSGMGALLNVHAGHLCLAMASRQHQKHQQQRALAVSQVPVEGPDIASPNAMQPGHLGNPYGLRHMVAHACLAQDVTLLENVLLDFPMWEAIYSKGGCAGTACHAGGLVCTPVSLHAVTIQLSSQ